MYCSFCKSEILFLKPDNDKIGLYCKSCGRWIKWVTDEEKISIQKQIDKQKREIRIDGLDLERVNEKYKAYKLKIKNLNDEILFLKNSKQGNSEGEKQKLYDKVLKLKELSSIVATYDDIMTTLNLKGRY